MPHRLITDSEKLAEFCHSLENETFVAFDTEFIREKTYSPQLCLVQVAGSEKAYAVDPLAPNIDLTPLFKLFANPNIVKVVHAGRQDVEIFYNLMDAIPEPLFDTQIAAQVCGFGESVSYSELVSKLLGYGIDKASRYTDWAKRPLSDRQITYALEDVVPLRAVYEKLLTKLAEKGRAEWIAEEVAILTDPATYRMNPEDAWERVKGGNLKPKQMAVLREIAAWRETEAKRRNLPRPWVLKDETLLEIAASMPHTEEDLRHIRGIGSHLKTAAVDALLGCVETALALPSSEWPHITRSRKFVDSDALSLLSLLLKLKASEYQVASKLIATRDELESLSAGEKNVACLQGWRYDVFGKAAEQLLAGELTIAWDAKRKEVALKAA